MGSERVPISGGDTGRGVGPEEMAQSAQNPESSTLVAEASRRDPGLRSHPLPVPGGAGGGCEVEAVPCVRALLSRVKSEAPRAQARGGDGARLATVAPWNAWRPGRPRTPAG